MASFNVSSSFPGSSRDSLPATPLSRRDLLGRLMRSLIDSDSVSRKFFVAKDVHTVLQQKGANKLYNDLYNSYSMIMQRLGLRVAGEKFAGSEWSYYGVFALDDLQAPIPNLQYLVSINVKIKNIF